MTRRARTGRRRWMALAVIAGCLPWSCNTRPGSKPAPNVLLVVADALRADHLGAYGYGRPTSPNFDALAARGTLFAAARSTTSWTNPAVESLFTGHFPEILQPGAGRFINTDGPTLAATFQAHGYRTAGIVANPALSPELGFAQGFDYYFPVSGWAHGLSRVSKQPAERVNAAALDWLTTVGGRPWFLYVHYMDTHWPYEPPLETARQFWRTPDLDVGDTMQPLNQQLRVHRAASSPEQARQGADLYDAAVSHFDTELGALLRTLDTGGSLANTWICITADHGEELGDHDGFLHARTLFEEVLHVPLLLVPPGGQPPQRVDRPLPITDIGRALLDAAALGGARFPGKSLDRDPAADEVLMAALMPMPLAGTVHRHAVLRGADKLVVTAGGQGMLFNLRDDPGEQHDVSAAHPELVNALESALKQSLPTPREEPASAIGAAARERMRALGYDF